MGQPASDLLLAATVAAELGASPSDPSLLRLISVASSAALNYLDRPQLHFDPAFTEKVAGFGRQKLLLGLVPLVSIGSVTLPDGTVVDPSEYELGDRDDCFAGILHRVGGCWPDTSLVRPGLLQEEPAAGSRHAGITVVYAGGWVTPVQAPTWVQKTYALGDLVQPTGRNGHAYKCTTPGASGSTEPTWSTATGATVTDGAAVLTELAPTVPLDLEHALIISVVGNYRGRGKYQRLGQETVTGAAVPWYDYTLPFSAKQLLDGYKRLN